MMTEGLRGSVTSTAVKFLGADSWPSHRMRRPSLGSWMAMPSPTLPNPPRSLWPMSFIFFDSAPFCAMEVSRPAIRHPARQPDAGLRSRGVDEVTALGGPRAALFHRLRIHRPPQTTCLVDGQRHLEDLLCRLHVLRGLPARQESVHEVPGRPVEAGAPVHGHLEALRLRAPDEHDRRQIEHLARAPRDPDDAARAVDL